MGCLSNLRGSKMTRKDYWKDVAEGIHVSGNYDLKEFLALEGEPVVSIYLPIKRTEREGRRDEWDRIELKDLAKEAERTLSESYDERQIKGIVEKLEYLIGHEDLPVWIDAGAGLGILINPEDAYLIPLSFAPKACVVAGQEYYLKPLIRNLSYQMDYILLLLNSDFFALLQGDYKGVSYVPLPEPVKQYLAETYPEFDGETTALDYYSLADHQSPYHDHKSRNEVTQEETEKFFHYVNKAMNDVLVEHTDLPIILVTLPEHESLFRKICTFKNLLPTSIKKDARTLSGKELRDEAVAIIEAERDNELGKMKEEYRYQASKDTASDDLNALGLALVERRVATLFLAAGKALPGTFDDASGAVSVDLNANPVDDKETDPAAPDIADAFARAAIAQDSTLVVVDQDKMPTSNFVAATYRF